MSLNRSRPGAPRRLFTLRNIVLLAVAVYVVALLLPGTKKSAGPANDAAATATDTDTRSNAPAHWPPAGDKVELAPDLTSVNYYVVLDGSGSMSEQACGGGGSKIVQARAALARFAQLVPNKSNLGLLVFDTHGVHETLPLGTDNRARFVEQVAATRPSGSTPLRSALQLARSRLETQARRQLGYGEYHLVVVTDGEASANEDPTNVVNMALSQTPIVIHTIGFCIGERHSLNQPGRVLYQSASDLEGLNRGLAEVLAESPSFDVTTFAGPR
jgi:uncharacterized protein YegL